MLISGIALVRGVLLSCRYISPFVSCSRVQRQTDRQTDRKTRLSVTPRHRTVQEGLGTVSCRETVTKSKHVLYWKLFTQIFALEGFVKA